ncbi:2'-5' RNA ligase family protein [Microbacterium oryzae]|uniref:2'-5' RNA ligase family protein n=1 Tax=Microbacterium oryzae TaxID=743009 RepID=UPI0025B12170|nr:2'-5' RNA ligase family protein [Microbacterium oryzae]MDN3310987.1 2'-5' RNA ligase family protein [Microbacterium oryzae]
MAITSIELLLDASLEEAVRSEWQALADARLSSLAAHTSASNRPHVTLLVREEVAQHTFAAQVARLPLPVTLESPSVFAHSDRGVLVRRVIVTPELAELHRDVHREAGPGDDKPHTRPDEWTPHVTLARRLRLTNLDAALAILGAELRGQAVGMRRWDAGTRTVTPLG